jgi:exosortase
MTPPASAPAGWRALSWPARSALLLLLAGIVALSVRLWPTWRHNPDLSHGFFMPLIFGVLVFEGRSGSARYLGWTAAPRLGFAAALLAGLLALVAAGLYAAAVDWSHALVNLMLALALALFLAAALFAFSRREVRLVPFNWTLLVACALWVMTAPIPPGTYLRLTLALQLFVSEGVLRTLHLFGIAAVRHGNIIDLANASVGVEEACSGIRSLISCVFAGFFFSATLVTRPFARLIIIALAAPVALTMNFIRSLVLTLLANNHVDISGTWHDATGFAVLGATAVVLGAIALVLERMRPAAASAPSPAPAAISAAPPASPRSARRTHLWLSGVLAAAAAIVAFFVVNTRGTTSASAPPDLFALLPESPAGWQVTSTDLYAFRGALQTDHLAQRHYVRREPDGDTTDVILYLAYWAPGQVPVSLVAAHTPDACWPGSGWAPIPTSAPRVVLPHVRPLPAAEQRLFQAGTRPHHVWFWHLYDGKPIEFRDPYSALELLRIALRYGFRREGEQLFVRISSNRPWSSIAAEPLFADFFARARRAGL